MSQTPHVLLVHGAWHGGWCWETLVPHLREAGLEVTTVDLPSVGEGGDLSADVAVVAAALDAVDGPSVLVGHSYGGQVISQVSAGRDDVAHLVYLCAFLLDDGESLASALGGALPPWFDVDSIPGSIVPRTPEAVFYGDVDAQVAAAGVARLRPQSLASFAEPLTATGWREHPTTYVACTQDQAIPYPAQEAWSARAGAVHTLESSHSPFLSHPAEVAAIIVGAAG